jgi:hypothetical protein
MQHVDKGKLSSCSVALVIPEVSLFHTRPFSWSGDNNALLQVRGHIAWDGLRRNKKLQFHSTKCITCYCSVSAAHEPKELDRQVSSRQAVWTGKHPGGEHIQFSGQTCL